MLMGPTRLECTPITWPSDKERVSFMHIDTSLTSKQLIQYTHTLRHETHTHTYAHIPA